MVDFVLKESWVSKILLLMLKKSIKRPSKSESFFITTTDVFEVNLVFIRNPSEKKRKRWFLKNFDGNFVND